MNLGSMKRRERLYRTKPEKPGKKGLMNFLRAYARRCRGTYYTAFNS